MYPESGVCPTLAVPTCVNSCSATNINVLGSIKVELVFDFVKQNAIFSKFTLISLFLLPVTEKIELS